MRIIYSVIAVVVSAVICLSETALCAFADAPQDIHLMIETKEIDINDIPEDRVISLDIYTENCPPYLMLSFLLEKDKRLKYLPYEYISDAKQVSNMGGISFELGTSETSDVVMCNIPAVANEKINYNGLLVRANLILPKDVKAGDFYSLNFRKTFSDMYDMETSIMLENNFDAVFGNESFSQLKNGGILITQDGQTEEITSSETTTENIQEEETTSPETENTDIFQDTEITENIFTETTVQTTTVTEITSDAVVSFSDATLSETSASSEILTNDSTDINSTTAYTKSKTENKKNNSNILLIIVSLSVMSLIAGIVTFIKKNRQI